MSHHTVAILPGLVETLPDEAKIPFDDFIRQIRHDPSSIQLSEPNRGYAIFGETGIALVTVSDDRRTYIVYDTAWAG